MDIGSNMRVEIVDDVSGHSTPGVFIVENEDTYQFQHGLRGHGNAA